MKDYTDKIKGVVFSNTAKDTFILFAGNVFSAFWGFIFILIIARTISVSDFGVFSAVLNLVTILFSLADVGISTGSVNFISGALAQGDENKANRFIKASLISKLVISISIAVIVIVFSKFISLKLLASTDSTMAIWAAVISIFWLPDMFFPYILQAKNKFLQSTIYDNAFYIGRLAYLVIAYFAGGINMIKGFLAFGMGFLFNLILTVKFIGSEFIWSKPTKYEYKELFKFSGWIAVNRVVSSVSGRLDIQMLAAMVGATVTGLYSIPSRLASFIVVLAGSYSSVLAPRLASFGDKEKEKAYILKSSLALIPISLIIVAWILLAKPFMLLLFGQKYLQSVPIFQMLAASQIPFLFTVPPVTAIIYAMKKTIYIGTLSFVQIAAIFLLNFYFIPKFGAYGPTLTFGITNLLLAVYVWGIVIKYYWMRSNSNIKNQNAK